MSDDRKILVIGDLHAPYTNRDHLDKVFEYAEWFQPHSIVQMGDQFDLYNFGDYPRNISYITPADEIREAREAMESFWKGLQIIAPAAKCYQLLGNHDSRIIRGVRKKLPELEAVLDALDYHSLFRYEGVVTMVSDAEPLLLQDALGEIFFHHGHMKLIKSLKVGVRLRYMRRNCVFGHTHFGGTDFLPTYDGIVWELNAGHLAKTDVTPLQYTSLNAPDTTPGFGVIDRHGPRFISLG